MFKIHLSEDSYMSVVAVSKNFSDCAIPGLDISDGLTESLATETDQFSCRKYLKVLQDSEVTLLETFNVF